jgi:hypothetical protein
MNRAQRKKLAQLLEAVIYNAQWDRQDYGPDKAQKALNEVISVLGLGEDIRRLQSVRLKVLEPGQILDAQAALEQRERRLQAQRAARRAS